MPTPTVAGNLGELRGGTASGISLTTTAALLPILRNARHLMLTPRAFVTAVVARVAITPLLTVLKTADALASAPTDYSENAQDGSATTDITLSSLSTAANLDFVYVGAGRPFRGVSIDVDAANGNASVLTVKYRKSDNTWADITATDGSDAAGASMGVDGLITWTVPTDWIPASLIETGDAQIDKPPLGTPLFWTRWQFSAALDSSSTLNSMLALAPSTAYFELASGQSLEMEVLRGIAGDGCIEALTDAGTGLLVCNFGSGQRQGF